jgi:hypothetical protein
MQVDRSNMLKLFRGRRVAIPLLAAGVALFVAFGGYRAIVSFAMEGMTGFLAGTAGGAESDAVLTPAPDAHRADRSSAPALEPELEMLLAEAGPPAEAVQSVPIQVSQAQPPAPKAALGEDTLTAAVVPPVLQPAVADSAVRKTVSAYTASFLRDPFYSLVQAGKDRPAKMLDVGRAKMVGSVWGESGIIALLEDDSGRSYALKVGDKVMNGRTISVTPASVTFSLTMFGITKTVTLELAEEGE